MSRFFGATSVTSRSPIKIAAGVDLLEPGEHPQRRRLPRPRRADEHDELAVRDVRGRAHRPRGPSSRGRCASPARSGRQPSLAPPDRRLPGSCRPAGASLDRSTAAPSSLAAGSPRRVCADGVEPEQRGADDRRRVGHVRGDARPDLARAPARSPRAALVAAPAEHAAAEHHLDGSRRSGRGAPARRARARRPRPPGGRRSRRRPRRRPPRRRRAARARSPTRTGSRHGGSPRRAAAGCAARSAPAPPARATCAGRDRPRCAPRR